MTCLWLPLPEMPLAVFENQCFPPSTIRARGVTGVLTATAVSSGSWCFAIFSITAVTGVTSVSEGWQATLPYSGLPVFLALLLLQGEREDGKEPGSQNRDWSPGHHC